VDIRRRVLRNDSHGPFPRHVLADCCGRSIWEWSENRVYSQWNSHLIGIMIINHWVSLGVHYFQTHPSGNGLSLSLSLHRSRSLAKNWGWFIPPIYDDFGDGLLLLGHITGIYPRMIKPGNGKLTIYLYLLYFHDFPYHWFLPSSSSGCLAPSFPWPNGERGWTIPRHSVCCMAMTQSKWRLVKNGLSRVITSNIPLSCIDTYWHIPDIDWHLEKHPAA